MKSTNRVLVIAAFPAMGKTYFTNKYQDFTKQILDSDSSLFSWTYEKDGHARNRNPNFPDNYLNYIHYQYNQLLKFPIMPIPGFNNVSGIIFTSTHSDVLNGLTDRKIPYIALMPTSLDETLTRLSKRNDSEMFINLVSKHFQTFRHDITNVAKIAATTNDQINTLFNNGKMAKLSRIKGKHSLIDLDQ